MYRRYEDPWELEKQLAEAKEAYAEAKENGKSEELLMSLAERINELEERVNHAWQDDEFDEDSLRKELY